jgi:hypothetical protein
MPDCKQYILLNDKHLITRARFKVSHRRPGHKDFSGTKLKRNYIWGYVNKKG